MSNFHSASKLIAVYDKIGHTTEVLKNILILCGRGSYTVASAEEPVGQNVEPMVLLFCNIEKVKNTQQFFTCVADYEFAGSPELDGLHPLTYSTVSDRADFTARNIRQTQDGFTAFEIVGTGVIGRVKLPAGCEQSVDTVLAAAAAAISCGISFAEVLEALNHLESKDL
jgi:UDP-N-acetylmuramyl pentapeptide synthase